MVSLGSVRLPLGFRMLIFQFLLSIAAVAQYEGKPIQRIEFVPSEQPLPREELDSLLPFRVGAPLRGADVRVAIQKLFETGRYSNVVVDAETEQSAVVLRIQTELAWFVGYLTVNGSPDPPSKGQLTTATKIELGRPFQMIDLPPAVENIQSGCALTGYITRRSSIESNAIRKPKRCLFTSM
jgi:outer membrane protein assembly factor BamA